MERSPPSLSKPGYGRSKGGRCITQVTGGGSIRHMSSGARWSSSCHSAPPAAPSFWRGAEKERRGLLPQCLQGWSCCVCLGHSRLTSPWPSTCPAGGAPCSLPMTGLEHGRGHLRGLLTLRVKACPVPCMNSSECLPTPTFLHKYCKVASLACHRSSDPPSSVRLLWGEELTALDLPHSLFCTHSAEISTNKAPGPRE